MTNLWQIKFSTNLMNPSRRTARINNDHVVSKTQIGFSGGSNRTRSEFDCTCGWHGDSFGASNASAALHAYNVRTGAIA